MVEHTLGFEHNTLQVRLQAMEASRRLSAQVIRKCSLRKAACPLPVHAPARQSELVRCRSGQMLLRGIPTPLERLASVPSLEEPHQSSETSANLPSF